MGRGLVAPRRLRTSVFFTPNQGLSIAARSQPQDGFHFERFSYCGSYECLVQKGFASIRLKLPNTGAAVAVFTTHLQAHTGNWVSNLGWGGVKTSHLGVVGLAG